MSKYFWLKMRRDFFKRHDIRIIESLPDGKEIVLFYVKLLAESVDHDGALRFSESLPYTPEMLATITDTTPDFAAQALETLARLDLLKDETDGTIVLPKARELIGSAADNDNAKRQARYRERHKNEDSNVISNVTSNVTRNAESNAIVTPSVTKSNESKRQSKSKSKSIDIEKELERESPTNKKFVVPTHDEILSFMTSYCLDKSLSINPVTEAEKFFNHYTANGWQVGRSKMKDYKAAARGWLLRADEYKPAPAGINPFAGDL